MGCGSKPEVLLADFADVPFDFDALQHNWVTRRDAAGCTLVLGVYLAGDGTGFGGAAVAELADARVAQALLENVGCARDSAHMVRLDNALRRQVHFCSALEHAISFPVAIVAGMGDNTILCCCEAINAVEFRDAAAEPPTAPAPQVIRAKAFTRIGVGRCQGSAWTKPR